MSSNSLSDSILQSSNSLPSINDSIFSSSSLSTSNSGDGVLEKIQNMSATSWLLVILILTFLGFNIFLYLAKGTEQLNNVIGPIVEFISNSFGKITGQIIDVSAEGGKAVVNTGAGAIDSGLTAIQNVTPNNSNNSITPNKASSSVSSVPVTQNQPDIMSNNTLNKALNSTQTKQQSNTDYQADEASSSIQSGPPKSGWCYIGEDRGFRTCAQVGVNDKCMSGEIFPSQEICINPNLRA
jgi:hypothetical protein